MKIYHYENKYIHNMYYEIIHLEKDIARRGGIMRKPNQKKISNIVPDILRRSIVLHLEIVKQALRYSKALSKMQKRELHESGLAAKSLLQGNKGGRNRGTVCLSQEVQVQRLRTHLCI